MLGQAPSFSILDPIEFTAKWRVSQVECQHLRLDFLDEVRTNLHALHIELRSTSLEKGKIVQNTEILLKFDLEN